MVYPAAIDGVISGFIPRVTGASRISLDEPPPRLVPPLKLRVERGAETPPSALGELAAEIVSTMHERLRITPDISLLEPGQQLERSAHKTRFLEVRGK